MQMFGIFQCGYLIIAINKCHLNLVQFLNEQVITQETKQMDLKLIKTQLDKSRS